MAPINVEKYVTHSPEETDLDRVASMLEKLSKPLFAWSNDLVDPIHKHHAAKLLRNESYRKMLVDDKRLSWMHLNDLLAASDAATDG